MRVSEGPSESKSRGPDQSSRDKLIRKKIALLACTGLTFENGTVGRTGLAPESNCVNRGSYRPYRNNGGSCLVPAYRFFCFTRLLIRSNPLLHIAGTFRLFS